MFLFPSFILANDGRKRGGESEVSFASVFVFMLLLSAFVVHLYILIHLISLNCAHRCAQRVHDQLVTVLSDLARAAGSHASPASSLLHLALDGSNTVADFKVSGLCTAEKDTIVHVEVRNPCAPSSFSCSYGAPRPIAEYAATAKMAKHR